MRKLIFVLLISILYQGCLLVKNSDDYHLNYSENAIVCKQKYRSYIEFDSMTVYKFMDTLISDIYNIDAVFMDSKKSIYPPKEFYLIKTKASIKNCKDTLKAKEMLYTHLKKRYNITTRDTTRSIKEFSFYSDSLEGFTKCESEYFFMGADNYWDEDNSEYVSRYTIDCKKLTRLFYLLRTFISEYLPDYYIKTKILINRNKNDKVNFKVFDADYLHSDVPSLKKYLKDTFNLDLKLTDEYVEKGLILEYGLDN